jgi:hypothetical protein
MIASDVVGTVIGSLVLVIAAAGPVYLMAHPHQSRPREDE